jgi:hypothetical protein
MTEQVSIVETKRINEAVKNNPEKFPEDFMFECTEAEWNILRSKFATLNTLGHGQHRKYLPRAFTEQGVYMLATILKSQTATEVTISIMRTFTKLRHYALEHTELSDQSCPYFSCNIYRNVVFNVGCF